MFKETIGIIEKEKTRFGNNVLQGMFGGAILVSIFINDTGSKICAKNKVVGVSWVQI